MFNDWFYNTPIEKGSAFQKLCGFIYAAPPVLVSLADQHQLWPAWYVSVVSMYQLPSGNLT